jgi:hypothetical protein
VKRNSAWQRVLQLAVTIERPQSRHKNQVAGLRSPVGSSFVPQADDHDPGKRPFAATVKEAKAVAQITGSFSLPWPSTVQRKPSYDQRSQLQDFACAELESFENSLRGLSEFLYLYKY